MTDPTQGIEKGDDLESKLTIFRQRLLKLSAAVIGVSSLVIGAACFALLPLSGYLIALGLTACLSVAALVLAERRTLFPSQLLIYGGSLINAFIIIVDPTAPWLVGLIMLAVLLLIGGLLLGPQTCKILGGADTLVAAVVLARVIIGGEERAEVFLLALMCLLLYPIIFSIVPLYSRQAFENLELLQLRLLRMEQHANELNRATGHLSAATEQISTMSQRHLEGAVQQSSAVKQIREALLSVTSSSRKIAETAHLVFTNADMTLANSERVHEHVAILTEHVRRIGETLQKIAAISSKSEVLALNASLEGTKAGEAGRGFSIVAKQMQQLAENVQASVGSIKALTGDIKDATKATELSMQEATKLARATTRAAREISLVSQQQQTATEQVANAMDDIGEITSQVSEGSEQTRSSTEDLADLAYRLRQLVGKLVIKES